MLKYSWQNFYFKVGGVKLKETQTKFYTFFHHAKFSVDRYNHEGRLTHAYFFVIISNIAHFTAAIFYY